MSKRSVVTARQQPAADITSVSGVFSVRAETITLNTDERIEVHDLTERVMAFVLGQGIKEGLVSIVSTHTTCSVFINEFQAALIADITQFLERVVERHAAWRHNDPRHSDCDRLNADAHLRAVLLGHQVTLQVSGGEVVLGQWQRILLAELDGPRARTVRVQVMGVS